MTRRMKKIKHAYCKLKSGKLIPKEQINRAFDLIKSLMDGFDLIALNDSEVMTHGDKFEAIKLFYKKYDCELMEAKRAIEFLRGEW